ncbi:MAG: dihydropteroate synthase [Candidatus Omnitrophica bacterium]|nr:dihydropteroate synthase [Candidatus Omnitrophota bacterium]MDE2008883.1 dihydropteroate synthase [Candidatus Omnitrophota bacterium]MDE2213554.1 dihydropteroate synthase [Candidatus Omnitrophota bacterium]MDE2230545.1 dihydropteroate synthase [Candidatus Omnitrophota bacterium]
MKRRVFDLHARGAVLTLGMTTRIMGIVNCTPDSFSGDGKIKASGTPVDTGACLRFARQMVRDGADILDVGGESTRPGASPVPLKEEIKRVIPVIGVLVRHLKVPISVDTSKLEVARRALDAGASVVNNVRGIQATSSFLKMVRDYQAAIVIMHMRGSPATMQSFARYRDVVRQVSEELKISVEKCLEIGIKKNNIIIDPGIGFAKTMDHNLALINHLDALNVLRLPVLLGTSRKSFIGQILHNDVPKRLMGTAATVTAGVLRGAHMVRVHDVRAIKETLEITDAILNARV